LIGNAAADGGRGEREVRVLRLVRLRVFVALCFTAGLNGEQAHFVDEDVHLLMQRLDGVLESSDSSRI
jgi:hypothetical protein